MHFLKRLQFLLKATNQHGVHSPFIYAFVTKCLYSKKRFSDDRSLNIALKMLAYFQISKVHLLDENIVLREQIQSNFPKIAIEKETVDFIYFDVLNEKTASKIISNTNYQATSIIFINAIHKDYLLWQQLIQSPKIVVSMDLFYCGILFFRTEQEKEDFRIRI